METNEKLTTQYQDFNCAWRFWQKWQGISQDDEEWKEAISDAEQLRKECGDRRFARDLICCVIDEIERRSKEAMG